jgi:hypothetical protein
MRAAGLRRDPADRTWFSWTRCASRILIALFADRTTRARVRTWSLPLALTGGAPDGSLQDWSDIEDGGWRSILVGNGSSINVSRSFGYGPFTRRRSTSGKVTPPRRRRRDAALTQADGKVVAGGWIQIERGGGNEPGNAATGCRSAACGPDAGRGR